MPLGILPLRWILRKKRRDPLLLFTKILDKMTWGIHPGAELFRRSKTADLISSIVNARSNQAADCSEIYFPSHFSNDAVVRGYFEV